MSWNRIYRPALVSDLHLDFVRKQIESMMSYGKFPQALLFAGPKGTGKTSTSRIIGAIVNDPKNLKLVDTVYFKKEKPIKPLNEANPQSELSQKIFAGNSFIVQEMDAASNRGIDDIRQLKTRVLLPPQEGKMSVFILDEVHMLTTEAFNALLKLLEEPPEHVIFILATTELHKIPATIVSRCQLVEFKKATNQEIASVLKKILSAEAIPFDDAALSLIANKADGSFRDAVKLLELAAQSGKVTVDEVSVFSALTVENEIIKLITALINKDDQLVVKLFEDLRERAVDQTFFHKSLIDFIHTCLLQDLEVVAGESLITKKVSLFLLQELSSSTLVQPSVIPHLALELKILELIERSKNKSNLSVKKNPETRIKPREIAQNESFSTQTEIHPDSVPSASISYGAIDTNKSLSGDGQKVIDNWHALVESLSQTNSTLAALLGSAQPISSEIGKVVIAVYYRFHQEQLSNTKAQTLLQECAHSLAGGYINFEFILTQAPAQAQLVEIQQKDVLLETASQALL